MSAKMIDTSRLSGDDGFNKVREGDGLVSKEPEEDFEEAKNKKDKNFFNRFFKSEVKLAETQIMNMAEQHQKDILHAYKFRQHYRSDYFDADE